MWCCCYSCRLYISLTHCHLWCQHKTDLLYSLCAQGGFPLTNVFFSLSSCVDNACTAHVALHCANNNFMLGVSRYFPKIIHTRKITLTYQICIRMYEHYRFFRSMRRFSECYRTLHIKNTKQESRIVVMAWTMFKFLHFHNKSQAQVRDIFERMNEWNVLLTYWSTTRSSGSPISPK